MHYTSLGPTLFAEEVKAGRAPQPVWLSDGRKGWRRDQLDSWLTNKLPKDTERADDLSAAINAHRSSLRSRLSI